MYEVDATPPLQWRRPGRAREGGYVGSGAVSTRAGRHSPSGSGLGTGQQHNDENGHQSLPLPTSGASRHDCGFTGSAASIATALAPWNIRWRADPARCPMQSQSTIKILASPHNVAYRSSPADFCVGAACGLRMRAAGPRKGTIHTGALCNDSADGREGGNPAQYAYGLFGCDPSLLGRLFLDVVERCAGNPSVGECLVDCRVFNDRTTRRIDEDSGRLHPPQRLPIEQVAGLRRERRLDDQIVRGLDKLIKGNGSHVPALDLGRIEERIIRPDIDAEWPHPFRDAACD